MARKSAVNQSRFARRETPRQVGKKPLLKFFLIVCEGAKTEPNYFEGMKRSLPPNVVRVADFKATGTGRNTLTVVEEAEELRAEYEKQNSTRPIDETWVVFDRDSFPKGNMNNAIQKAADKGIFCAWTNEAFELWYILHFQLIEHAMSRKEYQNYIEREIKQRTGKPFKYKKNSPDMFGLLMQHGDIKQAINRAKRLSTVFAGQTNYADHNPRTEVHTLVQKLLEFLKE